MIVIDSSGMVEALVGCDADDELLAGLAGEPAALHLLDVEVLSALRGLVRAGELTSEGAEEALRDHFDFTITRYEAQPLADRVWEMRDRFTSHDACYLVLAEALDAPTYTCDAKLDSGGHGTDVQLFSRTQ